MLGVRNVHGDSMATTELCRASYVEGERRLIR